MKPLLLPCNIQSCCNTGQGQLFNVETMRTPSCPMAKGRPLPHLPSCWHRETQMQQGNGHGQCLFHKKAEFCHQSSTRVLYRSQQREVSFILLHISCPTQLILPWNTHKLVNPRGASVRSGYSFFLNPLWYRRAVSPRKHHYNLCPQPGHWNPAGVTDPLQTPH